MKSSGSSIFVPTVCAFACAAALHAQGPIASNEVKVDWTRSIALSMSTPTLQVVVNPQLLRGARLHDSSFAALTDLGADYVRYVPWLPYPRQAVAELAEPADGKTSWDFSHIDQTFDDFMKATQGHSVIVNFSTLPAWMFQTEKPVAFPDDPNQVFWNYSQGSRLRDPSMKEPAEYLARLLSWYTKGGFTDEYGKQWKSGHHYVIPYWEVLNEIEFEHQWTPERYTEFYDAVTLAMRKVDPQIKFVALALARPSQDPTMFEYFLNPAHHKVGVTLDFISYHFYAAPTPDQTIENWQYTFFDQAQGFLDTVRYVESIRKRYSPTTMTDLDELGVILPEDDKEIRNPGYVSNPPPAAYWNLAGAVYAYLYSEAAKLGIAVVGESQLVGYPSQYPSVTMMDYDTTEPNARFWTLRLLKRNFGLGDQLFETTIENSGLYAQAFHTGRGKVLLLINKRNHVQRITLPVDTDDASVALVAPSTGDREAANITISKRTLLMEPFEVAVVKFK